MLDKGKLLEILRKEADFYRGRIDESGQALYEMNAALIELIETGDLDAM